MTDHEPADGCAALPMSAYEQKVGELDRLHMAFEVAKFFCQRSKDYIFRDEEVELYKSALAVLQGHLS